MNPADRVQTNLTAAEDERQHPVVVMRGRYDLQDDPVMHRTLYHRGKAINGSAKVYRVGVLTDRRH